VGVGKEGASATSATLQWVMRDGSSICTITLDWTFFHDGQLGLACLEGSFVSGLVDILVSVGSFCMESGIPVRPQ